MGEVAGGGAAGLGGFDGKIKEWPEDSLKINCNDNPIPIKKYSSNPKNNFIIELASQLYINSDFINTKKAENVIALECIRRAKVLYNQMENLFD